MNKSSSENFLSLKYLCNVKTNSVRNNTQKMENKTQTNIQQKIKLYRQNKVMLINTT